MKCLVELKKSAEKDLLLASKIIPIALKDDDKESLEVAMLAASEGFGMLKAVQLIQGSTDENRIFDKDVEG